MKPILLFFFLLIVYTQNLEAQNFKASEKIINSDLNAWHKAAASANFKAYFNFLTEDAVFIGTDAKENWVKKDFMIWAKPYFDKGKAWDFTSLDRHIHFDKTGNMAWFDELLNTQMKLCRGSGVLVKTKPNQWKLKQYVLSMTIPNDSIAGAMRIKGPIEDKIIQEF